MLFTFHIYLNFVNMVGNVFVYDLWRVQAPNLVNKNRIENPRGFS